MSRDYLETLLKDFGHMLTTETVIGQPMTFGKVTVVPVVSVSFGFGSGTGSKPTNDRSLSGSTAGAKLTPVAFLSIHEDGTVNLHHVQTRDANSPVDRLLEMAPGFIDKLSANFSKGKKDEGHMPDPQEEVVHLSDFGSEAVDHPGDIKPDNAEEQAAAETLAEIARAAEAEQATADKKTPDGE